MLIVSLGALRPDTWSDFIIGSLIAISVAVLLTPTLPRLYPSNTLEAATRATP